MKLETFFAEEIPVMLYSCLVDIVSIVGEISRIKRICRTLFLREIRLDQNIENKGQ